jgi:phosphonate transport system permease protein
LRPHPAPLRQQVPVDVRKIKIAPEFIAYTLYAFEINVRAATVLGLVGAGGVGVLLKTQIAFLNYTNVGIITAVTFAVVMLIDTLSSTIRRRLV